MKYPKSWDEARAWEDGANEGRKHCGHSVPLWSFDCGFKLDYDGPMVQLYCRFYPSEDGYDGNMSLWMDDRTVWSKKVKKADSMEELKDIVEKEAKRLSGRIMELILGKLDDD